MTVVPSEQIVWSFPDVGQATIAVAQQVAKRKIIDRVSGEDRLEERISLREGRIAQIIHTIVPGRRLYPSCPGKINAGDNGNVFDDSPIVPSLKLSIVAT